MPMGKPGPTTHLLGIPFVGTPAEGETIIVQSGVFVPGTITTMEISGVDTSTLSVYDCGYLVTTTTMAKTDSISEASSRFYAVVTVSAVSGKGVLNGMVPANFVLGLTLSVGDAVYLAAGADAGKLTNVAPTSGYTAEVGAVADPSDYAGLGRATILIQPKSIVELYP